MKIRTGSRQYEFRVKLCESPHFVDGIKLDLPISALQIEEDIFKLLIRLVQGLQLLFRHVI